MPAFGININKMKNCLAV